MIKVKEVTGKKAIKLISSLIEPIANIAQDNDFVKMFQVKNADSDKSKIVTKRITDSLPKLLETHDEDVLRILAAFNEESYEEYEKRASFPVILSDAVEVLTQEGLLDFLSFAKETGD